jgi:sugar phosphate isomerase/epimerase
MSVRTREEAMAVVEAAGRPNGAVLVDNLHLARTGSTPADLTGLDPALLPYAQLCDGPAEPGDDLLADALDHRCLPGEGGLPVADFVAALPGSTPLSLEVRSAALRRDHPDPVERARRVLAATTTFLTRHQET